MLQSKKPTSHTETGLYLSCRDKLKRETFVKSEYALWLCSVFTFLLLLIAPIPTTYPYGFQRPKNHTFDKSCFPDMMK